MARLAVARLAVGLGVSWLLMLPQVTSAQRCAEPHYRWSEKVDTALATRPKTPVLISEILMCSSRRQGVNGCPAGFAPRSWAGQAAIASWTVTWA